MPMKPFSTWSKLWSRVIPVQEYLPMLEVPRKRPKRPKNLFVKALAEVRNLQDEVVFLLTKAKVQHLIRMIKTTGCHHLDVKEAPKEVQGEVQRRGQEEGQGIIVIYSIENFSDYVNLSGSKMRKLRKFASRANCAITKNADSRKMRNLWKSR